MSGSVSGAVPSATPSSRGPRALAGAAGVLAAIVAASLGNAVIALLARAVGASAGFAPLHPSSYLPLTGVGILLGAAGWTAVRRLVTKPSRLLRWLVPVVVVASFVPDLAVLGGKSPGSGPLAVAALMAMHVLVAAVAVPVYRRVLPLPAG